MIGIILTGHGQFATGMASALNQVIGEQPQLQSIDFLPQMSTSELEQQIQRAIIEVDSGEGIVFFTDLLGGTPFRTAALFSQGRQDIAVLAGTNMQMAAEMLLSRDEFGWSQFTQQAIDCGQRGITSLKQQLNRQPETELQVIDGI